MSFGKSNSYTTIPIALRTPWRMLLGNTSLNLGMYNVAIDIAVGCRTSHNDRAIYILRMRPRSTKLDTVSQIRLRDLAPRYTGQGTARCLRTLRSSRGTRIPSNYVLASPSRYRRDTRPSHCFSLISLTESAPGCGIACSAVCQQGCDVQRQTLKTALAGQARDGLSTIKSKYTV